MVRAAAWVPAATRSGGRHAWCALADLMAERGAEAAAPPLHRSARVTEPGPSFSYPPTAVHEDLEGHAIAGRPMSCAAGISGVGWMLQAVPFQRSATSM